MRISIDIDKIDNKKLAERLKTIVGGGKGAGSNELVSELAAIFSPYIEDVLGVIPLTEVVPKILNSKSVFSILQSVARDSFGIHISSLKADR